LIERRRLDAYTFSRRAHADASSRRSWKMKSSGQTLPSVTFMIRISNSVQGIRSPYRHFRIAPTLQPINFAISAAVKEREDM
jgi:hypothetical protein